MYWNGVTLEYDKMPKMGLAMRSLSDAFMMIFSLFPFLSVLSAQIPAFRPISPRFYRFWAGPKITDHKICKSRMLLN